MKSGEIVVLTDFILTLHHNARLGSSCKGETNERKKTKKEKENILEKRDKKGNKERLD